MGARAWVEGLDLDRGPSAAEQEGRRGGHLEVRCSYMLHVEIICGERGLVMSEWRGFQREVVESVKAR